MFNTNNIFQPEINFEKTTLEIFHFQAKYNPVYKKYLEQLKVNTNSITLINQIPFLPIQFFKTHKIITAPTLPAEESQIQNIFTSSGTTQTGTSKHYVFDLKIYEQSFLNCFAQFYGNIEEYCLLALLPSYIERSGSSLVYMTNLLIKKTNNPLSGYYLDEYEKLAQTISRLKSKNQKFILLGVTYALLDFAKYINKPILKGTELGVIIETGGMKGKRKEMLREEVHTLLCTAFGIEKIHSEYGMTELLSQAYSKGKGIFTSPPWMKILIRDINDPQSYVENGKSGGVNIIDLANIYSCSFIATQDVGKKNADNTFEIMGRLQDSDLRGCNLMIE